MAPLALALHLALAAPGIPASPGAPSGALAPRLDPGPFRGRELALASVGALGGDLLVVGAGYLTLQLFAADTVSPTATNFRRAAYVLGATALLLPPLTAALLARFAGDGPRAGRLWKAVLLGTVGHAAALFAGYAAAPRFWLALPVQLVAVSAGTSLGLHWGPHGARDARARARAPAVEEPPRDADPPSTPPATFALFMPVCPDR